MVDENIHALWNYSTLIIGTDHLHCILKKEQFRSHRLLYYFTNFIRNNVQAGNRRLYRLLFFVRTLFIQSKKQQFTISTFYIKNKHKSAYPPLLFTFLQFVRLKSRHIERMVIMIVVSNTNTNSKVLIKRCFLVIPIHSLCVMDEQFQEDLMMKETNNSTQTKINNNNDE